jgi:hypothetical protein
MRKIIDQVNASKDTYLTAPAPVLVVEGAMSSGLLVSEVEQ